MRVIFVAVSLLWLSTVSSLVTAQAKGWRGIIPLHSTRADVERVLGSPDEKISEYSVFYRTPTETVMIQYAKGLPCGIGENYSQWRVPRGTVESILVTPTQPLRISALGIDESKYDKRQRGHRREDVYYINEQTGESFRVFMDEVRNMSYFPGTLDKGLGCPGLTTGRDIECEGLTPPTYDSYRRVSINRENSLLDNFSIALQDDPDRTGYIIAYAGKRARVGEAKAGAERAKSYLVKKRSLNPNRVKTIDGGYREQFEVELYVVPGGTCPPTAAPTIDPRDVSIVKTARPRAQRKR